MIGRSSESLATARAQLEKEFPSRSHGFAGDVRDAIQISALIDQIEMEAGAIDILVNSAGSAKRVPFDELDSSDWHKGMQDKFFAYTNVMQPVVKKMAERKRGAVVNIIGAGGKVASSTHLTGGAANAGLMLATAGMASAWGPKGIRINAVNPGATTTDRLMQGLEAEARMRNSSLEKMYANAVASVPGGRLAAPADIANIVVFLASPVSAAISGAIVTADGGVTPTVV